MEKLTNSIQHSWEKYIWDPIKNFDFWDAIDILLLATLLYLVYLFIRGRRAGKLALGLALILAFYAISSLAGLRAIHQLLAGVAPYTIILVAVIFQPELRDALEKLGSSPKGLFFDERRGRADMANTINEVVEAACQIAMADRDGALIVIERSTPLGDYTSKGYPLDAVVSGNLLRNIFVDRSPMHDGAVIIRHNRIAVAGSKLPLSVNEEVVKGMGTRHRAAVGITEVSDCVVVVVSEERHLISIANNGFIKRDYNKNMQEFHTEAGMKAVQNALRKDLSRLLAGSAFDEDGENGEKRRPKVSIRFRWRQPTDTKAPKRSVSARRETLRFQTKPTGGAVAPDAAPVPPVEPESEPTEGDR